MKTKLPLFFAALWLTLVAAVSVSAAIQASFYVDPTSGSDGANGTSPGTAFATIGRARTAVDAINGSMSGDIVVYLMPGDHLVTSTISLSEADSGTNGHDVIWQAYGAKGSARLIGGTKVTGWTLDSGNVWKATVPATTPRLEAVFENGVRGRLGRHPNSGYYTINAKDSGQPKKKFQWKSAETIPAIAAPTDVQVFVWPGDRDWSTEIHDVASIDRTNRWITLTTNIQLAYLADLAAGSRYYIQGARELVDQPGDFYHDRTAGILYYYPRTTPVANQEVIVPTVTTLFSGVPVTAVQTLNGHWQMEQDTSDSSSSGNDGAAVGDPVYVTGPTGLGDALSFDGATQYVTIPHDPTLEFGVNTNPFSLSAWIRTSASGTQPIIQKARPNTGLDDMDYRFQLTTAGQLELRRWNVSASTAHTVVDSNGAALNDGSWHHVVFVNEGGSAHKLYVDGALVETSTTSWTLNGANDQPVEIGRYRDAHNNVTNWFTGDIDDVRVYKSALGAGDVLAIYQLQPPAASPLQNIVFMNLKFAGANFDYANPTGTAQGMLYFNKASNLVIANNEFINGSAGIRLSGGGSGNTISGNAIADMALAGIFADGISDSLITNNHVRNTAQFFADPGANIRVDSVTDVEVSHNNLATSKRHGIRMRASTGVTIAFNEVFDANKDSQDTGAIYWGYADDNIVNNNRIHDSGDSFGQQHGMYVEDGSDRTVITNNIVYNIGNAPSNSMTAPINLKGVANLVQNNIFDFTRSHAGLRTFQILANAPANNEKILDNIFYSGSTSTNSTTFYDFQSYSSNRIDQSDRNVFRKTASGSNIFENIPGDDTLTNWKTLRSNRYDQNSVTTDPGFVDAANHNYNFLSGPPLSFVAIDTSRIGLLPEFIYPATVGQWIFSGNAADITLSGHDGTVTGASYVADRFGTASRALSLNGSSNYVNVPDDAALDFGDPAKPFTIVAWVKTSASTAGGIVAKARETNTPNMDYRLQMLATGAVQFTRWNQAAGVTDTVTTSAMVNDGAWHHVAFVNESATSHKIYIDGVLAVTSTTTWTHDNTNAEPVRIGRDRNGTTSDAYFNGTVDDVAILARALTLNDILDLNHLPHP
jgi:hypothetical protein